MNNITIYTDGACRGNPGLGSWAAALMDDKCLHYLEIAGSVVHTTNNKMELQAAISALSSIKKPSKVMLYSDSTYLVNGMTKWVKNWVLKNWMKSDKKPVENKNLWEELIDLSNRHNIKYNWVKAHSGDKYNERVDRLANLVMDKHIESGSIFSWHSKKNPDITN